VSELLYGTIMMIQGTIGLILADNIKSIKLVHWLQKSCKFGLIAYPICFIIRIGIYFEVHAAIIAINPHEDMGIGSFFAEYISDSLGSNIVSLIILGTFILFYLSNLLTIRKMTKMAEFINLQNEEYLVSQSILIAKDNKENPSINKSRATSLES